MRALCFRPAALLAAVLLSSCSGSGGSVEPSPSSSIRPVPNRTVKKWQRLADAPTARLEAASAVLRGKLYVAGGLVPGGGSKVVEIYDPTTDKWSRGPDLPAQVHHASGVAYRGAFLVIGGFGGAGLNDATDAVWSLECPAGFTCPRTDGWFKVLTLPRPRAAGIAGVVGRSIIVAGGQAGGSLVGPTDVYDTVTKKWHEAPPIPKLRDHLAGASDGRRYLYAAGGRELSVDSVVTNTERFDVREGKWETLPPLPTARGGFGAAYVGERFVTLGGEGPAGAYDQVESYDPATKTWSSLTALTSARHAMAVGVLGSSLYTAGGGPERGATYSKLVEALVVG